MTFLWMVSSSLLQDSHGVTFCLLTRFQTLDLSPLVCGSVTSKFTVCIVTYMHVESTLSSVLPLKPVLCSSTSAFLQPWSLQCQGCAPGHMPVLCAAPRVPTPGHTGSQERLSEGATCSLGFVRVCRICPLDAVKLSIGFKPTVTVAAHWHKPCGKPPGMEKISTWCFLHASDRSGYQLKGTRKSKRKNDLVVLQHTTPPRAGACGQTQNKQRAAKG